MSTEIEITFDDHPAKAVFPKGHQNAGDIMTKDGKPIPLIKDQWGIRLNKRLVGYCSKEKNKMVAIIDHSLDPTVCDEIRQAVKSKRGDDAEAMKVSQAPIIPLESVEDEEEDSEE